MTVSNYREVLRNVDNKKWQARLGKGICINSIYMETLDAEEEAARAYDIAMIRVRGRSAFPNFDISLYDVQAILDSTTFPRNGALKTLKRNSVDDVHQKRRKTRNVSSSTLGAPPSLHPIDQTQTTTINSWLQYQFLIPSLQIITVPHGYQNPTSEANRSFNPQYDYGGSEPTAQFQPIIPLLIQEFPSHQYSNGSSQHHLDQTPSSHFLHDTQNPNLVARLNNLASESCMEEFSSSQVHDASFKMMGTNEGGAHSDGSNQVVGNLGDPEVGLGNSDLDPASWL